GAVASLAFGAAAPAVDGNVMRVLSRVEAIHTDIRRPATQQRLWRRADELVRQVNLGEAGDFNSALMELGATICTPRRPLCLTCPVRSFCRAYALGIQERLPRKSPPRPR